MDNAFLRGFEKVAYNDPELKKALTPKFLRGGIKPVLRRAAIVGGVVAGGAALMGARKRKKVRKEQDRENAANTAVAAEVKAGETQVLFKRFKDLKGKASMAQEKFEVVKKRGTSAEKERYGNIASETTKARDSADTKLTNRMQRD